MLLHQGWEAAGRLRVSTGLEVERYSGSFYRREATDIEFPAISCDTTFAVHLAYTSALPANRPVLVQFALVYSTTAGKRRIRSAFHSHHPPAFPLLEDGGLGILSEP